MGKHHEFGRIVHVALSRRNFLTATVIIAAGSAHSEPGMRESSAATSGVRGASPTISSLAPVPTADNATLSFERSTVQTLNKEGIGNHNVASSSLDRPPVGKLYAPLEVLVPSSPFGWRINPFTEMPGEFHWGQDFAAPAGTLVYAADAGVVRAVGWHPWGGGNRVEIDHGGGLVTTYNHLQRIAILKGQTLRVGEIIAKVGTTGSSTGFHLHFETHLNGVYTNPMNWSFLPIKQLEPVGNIQMVSYEPGTGSAASSEPAWSVPTATPPAQTVTGGALEGNIPAQASTSPPPAPTPSSTPTPTPTASPTPSSTPTPTPTASPTPSSTPTPTPTASLTPAPSSSLPSLPVVTHPSPTTSASPRP